MRPIKFRAWNGTEMIDDYIVTNNRYGDVIVTQRSTACKILMQYTGLKDSKGREIYDGDIMQWSCCVGEPDPSHEPRRTVVEFSTLFPYSEQWAYDAEIIGNIYENSELIDKKK